MDLSVLQLRVLLEKMHHGGLGELVRSMVIRLEIS